MVRLFALLPCFIAVIAARGEDAPKKDEPKFLTEFREVERELQGKVKTLMEGARKEYAAIEKRADRDELAARLREESAKFVPDAVERAFAIVAPHAAESRAVEPLVWILSISPASDPGAKSADFLSKYHLVRKETLELAQRSNTSGNAWVEPMLRAQLASPALPEDQGWRIELALAELTQSKAALPDWLADAPDAEKKQFERTHGRKCLEEIETLDPAKLRVEALRQYGALAVKYPDKKLKSGLNVSERAKQSIFEIEHLAVGQVVPEIEGEDLDGVKFKLSDYRGKVVLLSFWGSWCGPCMGMVPHERELVERYKGRPFALVGVNSDEDKVKLKPILAKERIAWRSFWCGPKGIDGPIPVAWSVRGWPTLYIVDRAGVIRSRTAIGEALERRIETCVAEAEKK